METFDYISVMISIVLGLGIANMLNTIGILIRNKQKVIHSSTFYLHCAFLLLLLFQSWWTVFGYKDYSEWNFFFYLLTLTMISLIYLMTELLKVKDDKEVIDLETIFLNNKTLYFLIFIASVFGGAIIQSMVTNTSVFTKMNIFRSTIVLISFWGAFSSNSKVQKLIVIVLLLIYFLFLIIYRLNLGELSQ